MTSVPKRFKWKRALVIAIGLIITAVGSGIIWLYRTVAPVSGQYVTAGLTDRVTITFDAYQRPFVRAETLADALFAEGWLHAHHRLWQMEMFRRAGAGRLSELLGKSMLDSDKELWRMGVPQLGARLQQNASTELQGYVEAYVGGVNAAIAAGDSRPPEFLLLRTAARPWKPADVYAIGALMAFQSANNSSNELLRLALLDQLGEERFKIFLPQDGQQVDFPYVLSKLDCRPVVQALERRLAIDPLENPWMPRFGFGSNGWVVAPEKSATGNAIFAFDSHDALGLPNLYYEVHLFFEADKQIRGWSVAGLPGVINGYNERVAWGFTNIGDTQDLFIETRSESDPRQFKDGDEWYRADEETVEIPVQGRSEPEQLTVLHTRNGPLILDDPPLALRWTIQDLDGRGIDSILKYNRALSCEDFSNALNDLAAPSLNATFADIDGNIGFRTAGRIPLRGKGEGLVPLDGAQPSNRWQGYVPVESLPAQFNPETGFLAAANARVNAAGDGPLISADNAPGYRIRRIQSVLVARDEVSTSDMRALQLDWYDTQAALLMPTMIAAVDRTNLTPLQTRALAELEQWQTDWLAVPESAAPLIFQAWYRALATEIFKPAMGDRLFAQLLKHNYPLNHALDWLILRQPDSAWWRNDRKSIVLKSLVRAIEEVSEQQGPQTDTWRLDRMHAVKLEHELGKAVPQLSWLFNADPAPWGGGPATVGRARYRYDRAYDITGGATVRVVGEMKSPAMEMAAVLPGGQSGHPLSDHYQDQFPHWLAGDLLPIANSIDQVVGGAVQTLVPQR